MEKLPQTLAVRFEFTGVPGLQSYGFLKSGKALVLRMTETVNRTLYAYDANGIKLGWLPSDEVPDWVQRSCTYLGRVTGYDATGLSLLMATIPVHPNALDAQGEPIHYAPAYGSLLAASKHAFDIKSTVFYSNGIYVDADYTPALSTLTTKETTIMNTIPAALSRTISATKDAATEAAFLEAGRIANNKLAAVAASKMPMMLRGYAATPVGKAVIAVLVETALREFRPKDMKLQRLSQAMATSAMQEALRSLDIEGFINSVLDTDEIKLAMTKLTDSEPGTTQHTSAQRNTPRSDEPARDGNLRHG